MNPDISDSVRAIAAGELTQIAACFVDSGYGVTQPASGILLVNTPDAAPSRARLLLSVGVHGDETAPIEMLAHILHGLAAQPHSLRVNLMVAIGNLAAIRQSKRFIDVDMNRLFREGRDVLQSGVEAQRADELMHAASTFFSDADAENWHLDLHTAIRPSHYPTFAVIPANIAAPRRNELAGWLGQAGIGALIISPPSAGTFSGFTATRYGAASATVELGQVGALGSNDLSRFAAPQQAIDGFLRSGHVPAGIERPHVFTVAQELIKRSDAFRMAFDASTKNFTPMEPGTVIAEDGDTVYRVGPATEYVVFPNPDVRVGLRAGLMVVRQA
ncbi:succinylglutamate desuccinylase [Noviherbaspirillum sp.]|jgi:succinylglutamate desuccinylase|uniref:succinylglutamate desuccinylase n=1 Tax=Noviherbaspirillum sp. TaxID=1926288 RepID=UPI0025CECFB6|nr:succinylglutamate desuccinylase [Noviherbaspirillum sp.]